MSFIRFLLLPFFLLALAQTAQGAEPYPGKFEGPAKVVDGDSLLIGNEEMRLLCIDAVELHQSCQNGDGETYACGEDAKKAMQELIGDASVACYGHERDKYKRPLVTCRAVGKNLNSAIVEKGWAIATCAEMRELAKKAKAEKRGIWQGHFERPHTWRKKHPWTGKKETKSQ